MPARYPFLDCDGPIAFAHRGAAPEGLENTLAAVERVVRLGFGYLETDVRATSDGVAVLMHDPTLDRTTDRTGAVRELTWAQLHRARVGGREPVPRLDELLATFPGLRVNLDLKTPDALDPLAEVVRRVGAVDRVCVGSFRDRLVVAARDRLGPRLCTSLGPREVLRLRLDSLKGARVPARPRPAAACAQVPVTAGPVPVLDRRFVTAAHRRGLVVHAWTVNDRGLMRRLLDLGVDGIMSDDAPGLRAVLVERGAWGGGRAA